MRKREGKKATAIFTHPPWQRQATQLPTLPPQVPAPRYTPQHHPLHSTGAGPARSLHTSSTNRGSARHVPKVLEPAAPAAIPADVALEPPWCVWGVCVWFMLGR